MAKGMSQITIYAVQWMKYAMDGRFLFIIFLVRAATLYYMYIVGKFQEYLFSKVIYCCKHYVTGGLPA